VLANNLDEEIKNKNQEISSLFKQYCKLPKDGDEKKNMKELMDKKKKILNELLNEQKKRKVHAMHR
jgi:di/tripeptidase